MYTIELNRRTLANWERLTEENAHGVRLHSIACKFLCAVEEAEDFNRTAPVQDFAEVCAVFLTINTQHQNAGSLSPFLYDLREQTRARLRFLIAAYFGPGVAATVNP